MTRKASIRRPTPIRTDGTKIRSNLSVNCWVGERWASASATILTTRARVVSDALRATRTSSAPAPLIVPANTRCSALARSKLMAGSATGRLSTDTLSPVTGA